jgi:hypothetical protein
MCVVSVIGILKSVYITWYATDKVTVNHRGNRIACLSWRYRPGHVSRVSYRDIKSVYTTWYATDNLTLNHRGNRIGFSWSYRAVHVRNISYRDIKISIHYVIRHWCDSKSQRQQDWLSFLALSSCPRESSQLSEYKISLQDTPLIMWQWITEATGLVVFLGAIVLATWVVSLIGI